MANAGPDTNTSHFSIMLGPAHHLDGSYTIFGEARSPEGMPQSAAASARTPGLNSVLLSCGLRLVMLIMWLQQVVEGWEVVEEVNALAKGRPDNTAGKEAEALIYNSGQLR